jgi:hypothetical protein
MRRGRPRPHTPCRRWLLSTRDTSSTGPIPQLVLAMTIALRPFRSSNMYFLYAWPTFLALGGLVAYAFARSLVPASTALLAVILIIVGGDFVLSRPRGTCPMPRTSGTTSCGRRTFWPPPWRSCTSTHGVPRCRCSSCFCTAVGSSRADTSRGWLVASAARIGCAVRIQAVAYVVAMAGLCGAALYSPDATARGATVPRDDRSRRSVHACRWSWRLRGPKDRRSQSADGVLRVCLNAC